jgi:hypothetical protein
MNEIQLTTNKFNTLCTSCHSCMINKECPYFKTIYNSIKQRVNIIKNEKVCEINNKPQLNEVDKYTEFENLNVNIKKEFNELLKTTTNTCTYEQKIIEETIKHINNKYDIENIQATIPIIEQIIKLKIYDFRLMLGHKKYGMFQETDKGIKTIAGMHYSMEISDKIATLMEKLHKIVEGETINIGVSEDVANKLMNIWKKRKETIIDIPNLKDN